MAATAPKTNKINNQFLHVNKQVSDYKKPPLAWSHPLHTKVTILYIKFNKGGTQIVRLWLRKWLRFWGGTGTQHSCQISFLSYSFCIKHLQQTSWKYIFLPQLIVSWLPDCFKIHNAFQIHMWTVTCDELVIKTELQLQVNIMNSADT